MRDYDLSNARWFKSPYSDGDGGNCVEVAYDFPGAAPCRKGSHSDGNDVPGVVPVRDSKNPAGPTLIVPAAAWAAFVAGVRRG